MVDAVSRSPRRPSDGYKVDIDNVKVEKKPGGSMEDTKLIRGIALDKEVVHSAMPKKVEEAKIALVNSPLEIEKTEFNAKIKINDPDQMQKFLDEENSMLKGMVDKMISDRSQRARLPEGHRRHRAALPGQGRSPGGEASEGERHDQARKGHRREDRHQPRRPVCKDLGHADLAEERKVEEDKWVFIEGCKNPKAVTILIRGGSQRIVDEAERSIHDASDGHKGRGREAGHRRGRRRPRGGGR